MNYKNAITPKKSISPNKSMRNSKSTSCNLKLIPINDNSQEKISLFIRNQDYFLFNLLNKKRIQKYSYPRNIKINANNNNNNYNNDFPSMKIRKIIKVGKNGFYSFKKIDYNYSSHKKNILNDYDKNNNILKNHKKTLMRFNSCHFINQKKDLFGKYSQIKRISSPLIITHINKIKKEINKVNKYKRNFSSKSVQKGEIKGKKYDIINNDNIHYNFTIYKKNEGTQINCNNKENNIFFSERKKNTIKIDYCSPKSIIFHRKIKSYQINED